MFAFPRHLNGHIGAGIFVILTLVIKVPLARAAGAYADADPNDKQENQAPQVTLSSIGRLPIYNAAHPNSATLVVTVGPYGPSSIPVIITISNTGGNGSAAFDDGTTSKSTYSSASFAIRGKTNSSSKYNIEVIASYDGANLTHTAFTVSTWPAPQYKYSTDASVPLHFGYTVDYIWGSESGNVADLGNISVREDVKYQANIPNPPFTYPEHHTVGSPLDGTGSIVDEHFYPPSNVDFSTHATESFIANQAYEFRDNVLRTSWQKGVMSNDTITRTVAQDIDPAGTYTFKTGVSASGYSDWVLEKP